MSKDSSDDSKIYVSRDEDIFEAIKQHAPRLEDYIDTSGREWEQKGKNDWQGPHPIHGSETGMNFEIKGDRQRWRCYRQGHKVDGSIIDFIAMEEGIIRCPEAGEIPNHKWHDVIKVCCEKFGIEYEALEEDIGEDVKRKREERNKIYKILTDVAEIAHKRIDEVKWDGKTVREHLKDDDLDNPHARAFSDDVIDKMKIGVWDKKVTNILKKKYDTEELIKTGLFILPSQYEDDYDDPTNADVDKLYSPLSLRFLFPYWKQRKVVYFAGRECPLTEWEDAPKYIKLRSGEKYEHVSNAIKNDVFYGEDHSYGDRLFITEGITDCISLIDAGFSAISPATTGFREDDIPKLIELTKNASEIIVVNDNEESGAGEEGAFKTAKTLFNYGRNVKISFPPKPDNVEKVDVDDFLTERDNSKEAVEKLIELAKPYIDYRIEELKEEDYEGIKSVLKELTDKDDMLIEHSLNKLKNSTGMPKTVLRREFENLGGENPVKKKKSNDDSSSTSKPVIAPNQDQKFTDGKQVENDDGSTTVVHEYDPDEVDPDEDVKPPEIIDIPDGEGLVGKVLSETQGFYKIPPSNYRESARFQIEIRDKKIELTQRELLRPKRFIEYYLGKFNEVLQISDEDWQLILARWLNQARVRKEDILTDAKIAADEIISNITRGHETDNPSKCLKNQTTYLIDEDKGLLLYPSKSIQEVVSEYNDVSIMDISHELDELKAGKSMQKRIQDRVERFWQFDLERIEKIGRERKTRVDDLDEELNLKEAEELQEELRESGR